MSRTRIGLPWGSGGEFSALDRALSKAHAALFARHPALSLAAAAALHAAIVILFGKRLGISSNYFVLIPLIAAALGFAMTGGIVAGALGLPFNLLLFAAIGHPEYSPASKPIAELSGLFVGTALGYLSDYFAKLQAEIERRKETEASLREALDEKELLLQELHHRVKNNLNVIKSLVQLQKNRSKDPDFLAAVDELLGRIFSMALVHEQLYGSSELLAVRPPEYFELLAKNVASREKAVDIGISIAPEVAGQLFPADLATPLGLIVNEVLTNAAKHAFEGIESPRISLELSREGADYILSIEDNGRGFSVAQRAEGEAEGLGLKIIKSLAAQLRGASSFGPATRLGDAGRGFPGSRFELRFPIEQAPKNRY